MSSETESALRQELTVVQQAAVVKISDQVSYEAATKLLLERILPFRKRWEAYFEELRKPAFDAYQAVLKKFKEGDEPAEKAERYLKTEISRWDSEQERIRQELQRKAQAEAERQERERLVAEAVFAEEAGATDAEVVAEPVAPTYERVSAISKRENWKCRVTDIKALCKAIGAGKVPVNYVIPNETVLNARAKADKETLNIPGCVPYNEPVIAGRTR
jgi:ATPase subunit of ABC transporter with duplicated ATPase domains